MDKNFRTEFSMPFDSIEHILLRKPIFGSNCIEVVQLEGEDKVVWKLTFDENGAISFNAHLKASPIAEKKASKKIFKSQLSLH